MTQVTMQSCPHCGAQNPWGSTFCSSCGKALPTGMPSGPRVVGAKDFATTAAGQKLQGDELRKTAKKAAGALLAVAILQTLGVGLLFVLLQNLPGARRGALPQAAQILIGAQVGVAVIFWGLWFWARVSPLPAAIVGLVLYATLVTINVVTSVSQMSQNNGKPGGGGFGGIGIGWLDIIIIAVLVRAISAGATHRKLMQQQAAGI
ncbi:MAG TPA: zinc ribbon domain-containing protein [Tepidisphaeraceae bacterium]|jgi:hypothetical protein